MPSIIVGFSKPKKWKPFAWLIMKGYNSPYSHVYVKFWSEKFGRFLIYHASQTSVHFVGTEMFEQQAEVIKEFDIEITDESRTKIIQFAIDNAAKPYGIKNVIGLTWVRICEIFGKKIKNPLSDGGKTYVCCELVAKIIEEYISPDCNLNPEDINPEELYNFMVNLSEADRRPKQQSPLE